MVIRRFFHRRQRQQPHFTVHKSHQEQVRSSAEPNSRLETLPPEVRRYLLFALDFEELCALVHASPIFHQQYLLDRRLLLRTCLSTTLGPAAVDACEAYRCSLPGSLKTRTPDNIAESLEFYHRRRSSSRYYISTEELSDDGLWAIIRFHRSIVKPIMKRFTDWALSNLADGTKRSQSHESLSRIEETRIVRALYRFEILCNIFGLGSHPLFDFVSEHPLHSFSPVKILNIFFCKFEPWEIEEMACIELFAREKFDQIFNDILWDVHEDNPKFDGQRPPTPNGAFNLHIGHIRAGLLDGTISYGLKLLHTVIFTIKDHEHLVSVMQEHMRYLPCRLLGQFGPLGEASLWNRRRDHPSDRDFKQKRRDPLPFRGDSVADADGSQPPLAWTLMWGGTYSNVYGWYIEPDFRRWGYVFWDAARIKRTGAKELLLRQVEELWGDEDLRDDIDLSL